MCTIEQQTPFKTFPKPSRKTKNEQVQLHLHLQLRRVPTTAVTRHLIARGAIAIIAIETCNRVRVNGAACWNNINSTTIVLLPSTGTVAKTGIHWMWPQYTRSYFSEGEIAGLPVCIPRHQDDELRVGPSAELPTRGKTSKEPWDWGEWSCRFTSVSHLVEVDQAQRRE
jgi:hypothetical protein